MDDPRLKILSALGILVAIIAAAAGGALWMVRLIQGRGARAVENRILDMLQSLSHGQVVSARWIHNEFIARILRDVRLADVPPSLRPGGDPEKQNDLIPPKTPRRVTLRHCWRVRIMRELPSEDSVREILWKLKERGLAEQSVGDPTMWKLTQTKR